MSIQGNNLNIDQQVRQNISKGLLIKLAFSVPIGFGGMEAYELIMEGGLDALSQSEEMAKIMIETFWGAVIGCVTMTVIYIRYRPMD